MNPRVKNSKHIPGIKCAIAILFLAGTTGCDNRKIEDLQAKLLQEKENTIRFSIEKETAAKDLAALKAKLGSVELALSQSQEKQKSKETEIESLNTKLTTATNRIAELEAKASSRSSVPSSTFKVGSAWWQNFFDKSKITYKKESDQIMTFKIASLELQLFGMGDSLALCMHLGNGSISTANRWNKEKRFSHTYVALDGNVYIQSDLDLSGLENEEYVKNWFFRFLGDTRSFLTEYR